MKGEIRVNARTNMNSILKKKKTKNSVANYISKDVSKFCSKLYK